MSNTIGYLRSEAYLDNIPIVRFPQTFKERRGQHGKEPVPDIILLCPPQQAVHQIDGGRGNPRLAGRRIGHSIAECRQSAFGDDFINPRDRGFGEGCDEACEDGSEHGIYKG